MSYQKWIGSPFVFINKLSFEFPFAYLLSLFCGLDGNQLVTRTCDMTSAIDTLHDQILKSLVSWSVSHIPAVLHHTNSRIVDNCRKSARFDSRADPRRQFRISEKESLSLDCVRNPTKDEGLFVLDHRSIGILKRTIHLIVSDFNKVKIGVEKIKLEGSCAKILTEVWLDRTHKFLSRFQLTGPHHGLPPWVQRRSGDDLSPSVILGSFPGGRSHCKKREIQVDRQNENTN